MRVRKSAKKLFFGGSKMIIRFLVQQIFLRPDIKKRLLLLFGQGLPEDSAKGFRSLSSKLQEKIDFENECFTHSENRISLAVHPHDEIEPQKCGKVPNFAPITLPKNIVELRSKLWKKCRMGGYRLNIVSWFLLCFPLLKKGRQIFSFKGQLCIPQGSKELFCTRVFHYKL